MSPKPAFTPPGKAKLHKPKPPMVTADRADRLQLGMFIHEATPLLSENVPAKEWLVVASVTITDTHVEVGLTDTTKLVLAPDQLVLQGWAS